jgi:hypothetical protein
MPGAADPFGAAAPAAPAAPAADPFGAPAAAPAAPAGKPAAEPANAGAKPTGAPASKNDNDVLGGADPFSMPPPAAKAEKGGEEGKPKPAAKPAGAGNPFMDDPAPGDAKPKPAAN